MCYQLQHLGNIRFLPLAGAQLCFRTMTMEEPWLGLEEPETDLLSRAWL